MLLCRLLAFFTTLVLFAASTFAQSPPRVENKIRKWEPGQRVQVTFLRGEKQIGHLGSVRPDGFTLEGDKKSQASRDVQFAELRSVTNKWTTKEKWIVWSTLFAVYDVAAGLALGK